MIAIDIHVYYRRRLVETIFELGIRSIIGFRIRFGGGMASGGDQHVEKLEELNFTAFEKVEDKETTLERYEKFINSKCRESSTAQNYLAERILDDPDKYLEWAIRMTSSTMQLIARSFASSLSTEKVINWIRQKLEVSVHDTEGLVTLFLQFIIHFRYEQFERQLAPIVRELVLHINDSPRLESAILLVFLQMEQRYSGCFPNRIRDVLSNLIVEAQEGFVEKNPLSIVMTVLIELYPTSTEMCTGILLGHDLDILLQGKLRRQQDQLRGGGKLTSTDIEFNKRLLKLLSVACIDEKMRVYVAENYMEVLENTIESHEYGIYSILVLVKTWSFTKLKKHGLEDIVRIIIRSFCDDASPDQILSICIECLAYVSLKEDLKSLLRMNSVFCAKLAYTYDKMKNKSSELYGILVIYANLSSFSQTDGENKALNDLKTYSELKDPKDDANRKDISKSEIIDFQSKYILDHEIISKSTAMNSELTTNSREQVIRILYNLTQERKLQPECIKQGGIKFTLEYLVRTHELYSETQPESKVYILALRLLARTLMYNNPQLIFNKFSPTNAVPFLFELLPAQQQSPGKHDWASSQELTIKDNYSSLLALTNLASIDSQDGEDICKIIVNKYWPVIQDLLLDSNVLVQRSNLQLLSNLMNHPLPIAAKLFNWENKQSKKDFDLLIKLIGLEDEASQEAVVALFANVASTIPFIAQLLVQSTELRLTSAHIFCQQIECVGLRERFLLLFYSLLALVPDTTPVTQLEDWLRNDEFYNALKNVESKNDYSSENFKGVAHAVLEMYSNARILL